MSAWIEIVIVIAMRSVGLVALLVSAWIEIKSEGSDGVHESGVALLVSAWIEISS